jgi:hypothetical protein
MIRRAFLALCAIGSLGTPLSAAAQNSFSTGNDLLRTCNEGARDSNISFGFCMGFIMGVVDGWNFAYHLYNGQNALGLFCIPRSVNSGQLRDVIVLHLRQNPAERHHNSNDIILAALVTAFPCRSAGSR